MCVAVCKGQSDMPGRAWAAFEGQGGPRSGYLKWAICDVPKKHGSIFASTQRMHHFHHTPLSNPRARFNEDCYFNR
jgi:hypothetical protein